jgi:arginase
MADLVLIDAPIDCSGRARGEENAPMTLRSAGLLARLGARDGGEAGARIRTPERDPVTGVIGADDVRRGADEIAARVRSGLKAGDIPIVIGGDCTLLLGVFLAVDPGTALCFVDGHADFYDGETSPTGEAADMDLAILTGHGPAGLLAAPEPLVDPADVVLLGHRPDSLHPDVATENARLDPAIRALTAPEIIERGARETGRDVAGWLLGRSFWIHLDLDVLDDAVMPAVSYPQSLGLDWEQLTSLLRPLVALPGLAGASVADFNPEADPGGRHAAETVERLAGVLNPLCG